MFSDLFRRRGFAAPDALAIVAVSIVIVFLCLPALGRLRGGSMVQASLANLATLGVAHQLYAVDWNGRQLTVAVDGIASFGSSATAAVNAYGSAMSSLHPGIRVGWGEVSPGTNDYGLFGFYMSFPGNHDLLQPIEFGDGFGWFRIPNGKAFHDYVDGRFYGSSFYAPNDVAPFSLVEPLLDETAEFLPSAAQGGTWWSSYCLSPAALYSPDVLRPLVDGGWQDPWSIDTGLDTPPMSAALHPDLKTHMLEHHWNAGAPSVCNPAFTGGTFDGCEPWYFNHGIDAAPATLFYDGHVRLLPNVEVQASDQATIDLDGAGLWSRDTPLGTDGYFLDLAFDGVVDVSHHVLTTEGILGRDTLGGAFSNLATSARPTPRRFGFPIGVTAPPALDLRLEGVSP